MKIAKILKEKWNIVANRIEAKENVDLNELEKELTQIVEKELRGVAKQEFSRRVDEVGVAFESVAVDQAASRWAREYSYSLVRGIAARTREVVASAMQQYVAGAGMTRRDLLDLLEPAFGEVRANAIATTEVTRAFSQGTNIYKDMMHDAGIEMERVWHTNHDELVCPICRPLNEKREKDWDAQFPNGPPAHVNCRCGTGLRVKK